MKKICRFFTLLCLVLLTFPAAAQSPASGIASAKGCLPVPVTGQYKLLRPYGTHVVGGIEVGSKGCCIRGKSGCHARAVFEGKVAAVYEYETGYCVMLRHGSYLTVYAHLEDVCVRQGQTVKALAQLGKVGHDMHGERTLHFQIRQEREPLNPAQWIKF